MGGLNEIIHVKQLAQCLPYDELSINSTYILTLMLGKWDNKNVNILCFSVVNNILSVVLRTLDSVKQVDSFKKYFCLQNASFM